MMRTFDALMRRYTIRIRMVGAILIVLGLMGVVGLAGLVGGAALRTLNDHFMTHAVGELKHVMRIHDALNATALHEKQMVIDYEDGVAVLKSREAWQRSLDEARRHLRAMTEGEGDEDNAVALAALAAVDGYAAQAGRVATQLQDGGYDNARAADRLLGRAHDEFRQARAAVDRITEIVEGEAAANHAEVQATIERIGWGYGALLLVTMALVVPLTLLNSRSIVQPVRHARRVAQAIARGDLRTPIHVEGRDEAAELLEALATMQDALRGMVGSMRAAADGVRTASAEVATGNGDLSHRTEQTAGSLQQAASSMEQLTGTVRQTAESARQAAELAAVAAEVAWRGGQAVEQVVTTMGEISQASRKIADIIGTIDGIAFQTNILALNAAVEAARAGEQGRGFAVVAAEVRSLASRSAEAAKQIKGLIGASVDKVESGSTLACDAGRTMAEIVASVQRVNARIGEITAAANEQSEGIGQVNASVTEVDRMTQQNAALVEQSAAAAESLRDQARVLGGLVERFELDAAGR